MQAKAVPPQPSKSRPSGRPAPAAAARPAPAGVDAKKSKAGSLAALKAAVAKASGKPIAMKGGAKAPIGVGAKAPIGGGGKASASKVAGKAGGAGRKDGKAPAAVPPPPPRKVQVVQLTTLKPGAKGTRAAFGGARGGVERKTLEVVAKRRRSASLTPQQVDHFRELLSQRRSRISVDLTLMQDEALKVTGKDSSSDSVADTGSDNYEQDFTLGLIESEEALAREIDQALVRLNNGEFGVCESCETPIPLARLEIVPFARCCVVCQQKREAGL